MFSWTDRELNEEQDAAVRFEGSQFLVACPGSGKTRTLTYKIAYELSRLTCKRQFVVAITYTNRAADEIHERIEALGVDTTQLWIGTIHAFCLEWILKPYGIYEPALAHGFGILDLHEREKLLEELCEPYREQRVTFWDCDYYFTRTNYYLGCRDARKHSLIEAVLERYFQILLERRLVDFEMILRYAYQLTTAKPAISQILANLFSIILVDEYQDTKEIQYEIVASILRAGAGQTKLFMVGDPNQGIFGSLGGYPIELGELTAKSGIQIEPRALSRNYRSSQRIIDYFGNFNVHGTTIVAAGGRRDFPSKVTYNPRIDRENLADEVARLIRHSIEDLGIHPDEICVVAPQWPYLTAMTKALVVRLPDRQFNGPGIVPFARDIENFWYKVARLALTEPSPQLYVRRLRWAGEVLAGLNDAGVDVSAVSRKHLLRECNTVQIDESDGLTYLHAFFDALFERLDVSYEAFGGLLSAYTDFFDASQARIQRLRDDGVDGIEDLAFFKRAFQPRSGITVSTIHGVKGAEFDVVIGYALLEGMVPHFNDADGDASAQKMLYVVGSRARKHLHLFSEAGRPRGRRDVYLPTRRLAAYRFEYDTI
ncbi:ATP-dependent helicase [Comamonas terrigena]|uniref:ATP-dependent helicase n=1 Tax=Comamonas terrigena TaxID=32013 RepID=UPI002447C75A|nr:ATP-dependent helicase [Comamonas terrigena]MDH1500342.1 ATP-dependent helicase [Comamonas terrigena]